MKNKIYKFIKNINYWDVFLILILFAITYFFPYTHDDWAWGSSIGIERLTSLFKNYNGRWAGNILVILLTRNRIIKSLVVTFTITLLVVLGNKFIKPKNTKSYLMILLLELMPIYVLIQSIVWTSGFANYTLPSLITLFIVYLNKNIFANKEVNLSNKFCFLLFILGLICSLFVEHMTIYNVCLGLFLVIYPKIKKQKVNLSNIFYLIGSIIGAMIMFLNGAYKNIFALKDGYRSVVHDNFIINIIRVYFTELKDLLVGSNIVINILLSILCLVLVYKFYKVNKKNVSKIKKNLLSLSGFILLLFLTYTFFIKIMNNTNPFIKLNIQNYFEGILYFLVVISILIISSIAIKNLEKRNRIIFEIISIFVIAMPLLFVSPIGPRCFFSTYYLFVLLTCELADEVLDKININYALKYCGLMMLIFIGLIYGYIFKVDYERVNYIKNHKKEEYLLLPLLPNEQYLHNGNPASELYIKRFKLFYEIDTKTKIEFISYEDWKK